MISISLADELSDDLIRKCLILGCTATGRIYILSTLFFLAFSRFCYQMEVLNLSYCAFCGLFVIKQEKKNNLMISDPNTSGCNINEVP